MNTTFFHIPPLRNALSANVNDSIDNQRQHESRNWGCGYVFNKMVNAEIFGTAPKAVEKNPKNMSSKIYDFSTM